MAQAEAQAEAALTEAVAARVRMLGVAEGRCPFTRASHFSCAWVVHIESLRLVEWIFDDLASQVRG